MLTSQVHPISGQQKKKLGLYPHGDIGWLAMPPEYLPKDQWDTEG